MDRAEAELLERRAGRAPRSSAPEAFDHGLDPVDIAAAAAAALDGAVLNGMPPSPIVADLTRDVTAERDAALAAAAEASGPVAPAAPVLAGRAVARGPVGAYPT